jgi:hypothetical protein
LLSNADRSSPNKEPGSFALKKSYEIKILPELERRWTMRLGESDVIPLLPAVQSLWTGPQAITQIRGRGRRALKLPADHTDVTYLDFLNAYLPVLLCRPIRRLGANSMPSALNHFATQYEELKIGSVSM